MKKCLLLGNGGREAVLAEYISKGYELYTVCPYTQQVRTSYTST